MFVDVASRTDRRHLGMQQFVAWARGIVMIVFLSITCEEQAQLAETRLAAKQARTRCGWTSSVEFLDAGFVRLIWHQLSWRAKTCHIPTNEIAQLRVVCAIWYKPDVQTTWVDAVR